MDNNPENRQGFQFSLKAALFAMAVFSATLAAVVRGLIAEAAMVVMLTSLGMLGILRYRAPSQEHQGLFRNAAIYAVLNLLFLAAVETDTAKYTSISMVFWLFTCFGQPAAALWLTICAIRSSTPALMILVLLILAAFAMNFWLALKTGAEG